MMSIVYKENEVKTKVDLLDRDDFIERMLLISDTLAENAKNVCYAINGSWGVGKSFVLDMFEERAKVIGKEGDILSKYLIFRYNCWEYDYYDEPLIAIISSMLDEIENKTMLIPKETREQIIEILKVVGKGLMVKATQAFDERFGLPSKEIIDIVKEGRSNAVTKNEQNQAFDQYITFKKTLKKLQNSIMTLVEHQTVIVIVDELDRCLPEYSIRVLERLHHLFGEIPNVQVILSIDKNQLGHTIRQIYGNSVNTDKYLAKFLDFEIKLSEGSFNEQEKFSNMFKEYTGCFDYIVSTVKKQHIDEYLQIIFEGLDIRSRISIIKKCLLLHNLINKSDSQVDIGYMCIELLLTIIKNSDVDVEKSKIHFLLNHPFTMKENTEVPKGLVLLTKKFKPDNGHSYYWSNVNSSCVRIDDIWGLLLATYRHLLGKNDQFSYGQHKKEDIKKYVDKYWAILEIIN